MREMTLGVDLSDSVVRVVVVNDTGQVLSRAELAQSSGNLASGVRDAAKRAIAGAGGTVSATAVALPLASDDVPGDIASALADVSRDAPVPQAVGAGTAAAIAEQWCGAARGLKQVITFCHRRTRDRRDADQRRALARRAWAGGRGRLAGHESRGARRLPALRRARGRDRRGRHREAPRVAHQVGRSLVGRRSPRWRPLASHRRRRDSRPRATATACAFP